jgi:hypothetical protein
MIGAAVFRDPLLAGDSTSAALATSRPLAAGSARENLDLAPQAASWNPPHRPGPRLPAEQAEDGGRSEVKRSRAGSPHGEPRSEPPSEAEESVSLPDPGVFGRLGRLETDRPAGESNLCRRKR